MKRVRCFVAVAVEAEVRRRLAEVVGDLAAAGADVRWVREEGLHCTLRFLGSVEAERLAAVQSALAAALVGAVRFDARVGGLGTFGGRAPRVVWAGLGDDDGGFAELAARVAAAVEALGFAAEDRPFRPHLTLGRVRSRRGWGALAEALRTHADDDFGVTAVDRVALYRSQPTGDGSVYTVLRDYRL